ncbi:helix-turn-helix domain-containing protein [Thermus sp.]|uniref:helix-turn-helix domain-containing protein n=1 Tax=Thermus sp. TaxID=275 RepID=UPI00298F36D7|nr:helix-turn-helix domain-containing protein [Thermus sp.]MDW8356790.1 helix-turn-helix domain-containing protein [Thermus sp.]
MKKPNKAVRKPALGLAAKPVHEGINKLALTPEELAEALGISLSTTYNLIRVGRIRHTRVGRRILVPLSAVEEFLNAEEKEVSRVRR